MARLNLTPVPMSLFSFARERCELVAEASTIGLGIVRDFERIYDDAADQGIAIRGKRETHTFYVSTTDVDREGETVAWYLRPIDASCPVRRVTILND